MSFYEDDLVQIPQDAVLMDEYNEKLCGIYLIHDVVNNMLYVGETTVSFQRRIDAHFHVAENGRAEQKIDRAIADIGSENFDVYILEIIDSDDQNYFFQREDAWIDELGTLDDSIGYNVYHSPMEKSEVDDDLIYEFLEAWSESYEDLDTVASEFGLRHDTASRFCSGQRRRLPGQEYPVYSAGQEDQLDRVKQAVELLLEDELTFDEIADEVGIVASAIGKYNQGEIPEWALKMDPEYFEYLEFPLKDSNKAKIKTFYSDYLGEIEYMETDGRGSSMLANLDPDYIFELMLQMRDQDVIDTLGLPDLSQQNLRKFMKQRGYPSTNAEKQEWLEDNPHIDSIWRRY